MKSPGPWLSVVMPIFNGAETLGESLDSLLDQSKGIEVVLVDQGSTDGSLQIAQSYSRQFAMTILEAPELKNWVQNTNLAINHASSPVITMLHQDDLWKPRRANLLRTMMNRHPNATAWLHASDYVDAKGKVIGRISPKLPRRPCLLKPAEILPRLIVQNTISLPSIAFRRSRALEVGGLDETLWYTADWDFWLKILGSGTLSWEPQSGTAFRLHHGSQTFKGSRNLEDFECQLRIPLERHIKSIPHSERLTAQKRAEASNAINLWLAAKYHGQSLPFAPLAGQLLRLGPLQLVALLKDTQLLNRMLPRIRLRRH